MVWRCGDRCGGCCQADDYMTCPADEWNLAVNIDNEQIDPKLIQKVRLSPCGITGSAPGVSGSVARPARLVLLWSRVSSLHLACEHILCVHARACQVLWWHASACLRMCMRACMRATAILLAKPRALIVPRHSFPPRAKRWSIPADKAHPDRGPGAVWGVEGAAAAAPLPPEASRPPRRPLGQ
eukprot:1975176-Rhodomonas_salina.1